MNTYQILCIAGVQALVTAIIGGLVGAAISAIQKKRAKLMSARLIKEEDSDILKKAMCDIIRTTIYRMYVTGMEKGFVSFEEQENFVQLCDSYFALGGNSYVHEIRDRFMQLKVRKERE